MIWLALTLYILGAVNQYLLVQMTEDVIRDKIGRPASSEFVAITVVFWPIPALVVATGWIAMWLGIIRRD